MGRGEQQARDISGQPLTSRPPAAELTARLAYVDFDGAKALAASEAIPLDQPLPADFINNECADVLTATRNMVDWLDGDA